MEGNLTGYIYCAEEGFLAVGPGGTGKYRQTVWEALADLAYLQRVWEEGADG